MSLVAIQDPSLVVLIGAPGAGKSTFAARHFRPTEVISSDLCRAWVSDDVNDLDATTDAFAVLHFIADRRLARGKLTVIDATNVQPRARAPLVELARAHDLFPVAIVFDLPERLLLERNRLRPDRDIGSHVIRRQLQELRRSRKSLRREGFRAIHLLDSPETVDAVAIERQPLWNDRRDLHGPFDIIGDVHGCYDELLELLDQLGYELGPDGQGNPQVLPPSGRTAIFLGDLVDRGPRIPDVLRLVMSMVEAGTALCLPGNHDMKLVRKLRGRNVTVNHGLAESLEQLGREPPEFVERVAAFLDGLVSHYVLDDGKLLVAHAGMKAEYQGRSSGRVRDFALYGATTGESDEVGLPVRLDWAADYRGAALVVYGHTPIPEPIWHNRTINIDTGCVFGGRLTALRYPERELVSVPSARVYSEPTRPLVSPAHGAEARPDDLLDIDDVLGRRTIATRLMHAVTVREENAAAALEVMSRFAVDPRWLIYLPPTMSPSRTSDDPALLERPDEAFDDYQRAGVDQVICEEKHMGSRAIVIVCREPEVARRRFGVQGAEDEVGICYTRTGRRFFGDAALGAAFLDRVRRAMERSGLWQELETDWACLDCELMPWSLKAQELLRLQYAAAGAAGRAGLDAARLALQQAVERGIGAAALLATVGERAELVARYTDAYRRYCWPVDSLDDLKLAPFQILASEGRTYLERDHGWHLEMLARLAEADRGLLRATDHRVVDLADGAARQAAAEWWQELTGAGGEGMVVKPLAGIARGKRGLVQPALKCRGREYLRIIYGPEYTLPEHLARLRSRNLGRKRALALREFALGVEALERFVAGEPLYRVHECVFGVLALESEPVDPRL